MEDHIALQHQIEEAIGKLVRRKKLQSNGATDRFPLRVEVPVRRCQPLAWLNCQKPFPRIYWRDRKKELEIAAVGAVQQHSGESISDFRETTRPIEELLNRAPETMRFYGGLRFDVRLPADETWQRFGSFLFVLPRFELISGEGEPRLAYNFIYRTSDDPEIPLKEFRREWTSLIWEEKQPEEQPNNRLNEAEVPERPDWEAAVSRALQLMRRSSPEKVVLARKKLFRAPLPFSPLWFLQRLHHNTANAFLFLFQLDAETAFLGATPERLFRKSHDMIESDALASTRPRGATPDEDLRLEQELLTSTKELTEHRWVSHMIETTLKPLCEHLDIPLRETVLKLATVQHIYTLFRGELKDGVGVGELLQGLHPTPAVAGIPRQAAMQVIAELEGFDRGWYAGPVGWISRYSAEFAVAIRSALISGNILTLFAGAGIVEGSVPAQEWQETESKFLNFTRLLRG